MSNQLEWEACRYVLEDPTLDRQAFELRMLDDVELALAVARAMSDVELLRAASHRISQADQPLTSQAQVAVQSSVHVTTTSSADIGWHWTSLAALAATLLLAVGMAGYSLRQFARNSASSSMASHTAVASRKLAGYSTHGIS